ncbi:uncharacterized protein [Dysidea avara]|uniref:uncharacterized protein n=1 Tax=Dysidea avara TaxID=196820 RepID=UPI0033284E0E
MQSSPAPLTKEGPLLMYHGGFSKTWKPCYLSLQRAYLHVYESKESTVPKESIVRSSIKRAGPYGAGDSCKFEIEFTHRANMLLEGSSKLEVSRWIHVLLWHHLPTDIRDVLPTGDESYSSHGLPTYEDVVEDENQNASNWMCLMC